MVTGDDDRDVDDDDYYNDVDIGFSNRADDISGFDVYLFFFMTDDHNIIILMILSTQINTFKIANT